MSDDQNNPKAMNEPKPNGSPAPRCKCGKAMRYSRRRALDIKGWICPDMVTDFIRYDWETARANHTKPITAQENSKVSDGGGQ